MPAMLYTVRWPDAHETIAYSPSLVIQDFLKVGQSYALEDFRHRVERATDIANERVQAKFGFVCSRANDQLSELRNQLQRFEGQAGAQVTVVAHESVD